jgi:hypothetical protein
MLKIQHRLKEAYFGSQHAFRFPLGHTFGSNFVPSAATASFVFVSGSIWVSSSYSIERLLLSLERPVT